MCIGRPHRNETNPHNSKAKCELLQEARKNYDSGACITDDRDISMLKSYPAMIWHGGMIG